MPRLVLAGGSGFLGKLLARHFTSLGWNVVVLTRTASRARDVRESTHGNTHGPVKAGMRGRISFVHWDGRTPGPWTSELEGARAVINLAGRSVNCRYHARNRRLMMDSRVVTTRLLGRVIAGCHAPPPVWLNASTATIYRHTYGEPWDEGGEIGANPEAKDAFSIEVAGAWERAFDESATPATRKVKLRGAMVLGLDAEANNVFRVLHRLARFGLGGAMGHGRQYVSWIHETDFCRSIEWILGHGDITGPVNLAAPHPLTNGEMMALFRKACGMPLGLPAAHWMLEVGAWILRTETELIIKSRRVVPGRLLRGGFRFHFEHMADAVLDLVARLNHRPSKP
ncbi:MAG TPA: DUF1731 domain-containing protein [Methylomirabilota bacterium]|nr:DUF1731 domain-containing protein [Methylomirabilota bacterium]